MDFQKDVIGRSYERPVVVDFWAPWCGPCRVLGPVIEQLASEEQDRWDLVKLNTEEEQQLAAQYQIRSIPNVKMFYRGEVIGEFAGALSRPQIQEWLANTLPDARKEVLGHILDRLGEAGALSELEAFVAQYPDMQDARLALAMAVVVPSPERALALLAPIPMGSPLHDQVETVRALAELMQHAPDPSAAGQALLQAQNALRAEQNEEAIKQVIQAVMADKAYANDLPRRAAIALFHAWGADAPLTKHYRRRFDMALY
ncbi:thioredoxin [Phaeodactylibacter luteus]|uniref:Thioredoxin n=1 Tax=Phaeodactylibacter luteus TaxID=1564516 RepID=A0A5C6RVD2_9BACT|nr:thioredoxin [Phaeodactylibacter luteus]TXB66311.1 thioredoxin [Phaeodactylibacter luteus]